MDNGGLFADIGFSSGRTILASFDTLGSGIPSRKPPAPSPLCFLRMITSCIMRNIIVVR